MKQKWECNYAVEIYDWSKGPWTRHKSNLCILHVVVVFNSDKNAHKCEKEIKLNYKIFNSTWSLSGAQNILNLNVKSLKMNQHTTAHKSLWADYIYVTSGQAKKIKYE